MLREKETAGALLMLIDAVKEQLESTRKALVAAEFEVGEATVKH